MTDTLLLALRLAAILGSGLMAGLFFAFSFAVMGALARIQPAEGIAAMQSINRVILNPVFLLVFMGTAAACALVLLSAPWRWQEPGALWLLLGAASYIIGTFVVTIVFNVPLNNALAAVEPASTEGARVWARYLSEWVAWNHVRTATSFAAMMLLTVGLYLEARG
jgi:uncharacterized membrane protein